MRCYAACSAALNHSVLSNHCYGAFRMLRDSLLFSLVVSFSTWSGSCLAQNTYQISLITEDAGNELRIGVDGAYQKELSKNCFNGICHYGFGVFAIPAPGDIDIKLFSYNREQRRVRLVREHSSIRPCTVSACGEFEFIKTQSPVTSFSGRDICNNLRMSCPRGGSIR